MIATSTPPRAHTSQCLTPGGLNLTKDLIATANHQHSLLSSMHKSTYCSPSPVACNPDNNVCKVITYRGEKVAAFNVEGRELICLPQAFELFLKHLVGGLHTVYTKLKRLDITPVVCNVEQVRILRGLGAIQPGVNRCKLISCKEFDILYEDCTNSSARPGRPPKRSPSLHASPDTIEKLKKCRVDGDYHFDPRIYDRKPYINGFAYNPYAMSHLPFMTMPPMNMLTQPGSMVGLGPHLTSRSDHVGGLERPKSGFDLVTQRSKYDGSLSLTNSSLEKDARSDVIQRDKECWSEDEDNRPLNLQINGKGNDIAPRDLCNKDDKDNSRHSDDDDISTDDNDNDDFSSRNRSLNHTIPKQSPDLSIPHHKLTNGDLQDVPSIEAILLNIQRLLEVATENARRQELHINLEKAGLKTELNNAKKIREALEKDLNEERKQKDVLLRKLRREKHARKKLQRSVTASKSEGDRDNRSTEKEEKNSSVSSDSDEDKLSSSSKSKADSTDEEEKVEDTQSERGTSLFDGRMLMNLQKSSSDHFQSSLLSNTKTFPFINFMNGTV